MSKSTAFHLSASTLAALEEMLQNAARHIPSDLLPIYFDHEVVGHLHHHFISPIQAYLKINPLPQIQFHSDRLVLLNQTPYELSQDLRQLAQHLHEVGLIPTWRKEEFAWYGKDDHEYFRIERAAFRTFGFCSRAAHINGYTRSGKIWVGRRSEIKVIDPGLLDNLAAGGVTAGETVRQNAIRELWVEAGIPEHIAQYIQPQGKLLIKRPNLPHGFHHENLFMFDLQLPENIVPKNHDGEVSGFIEIDFAEAAARILADEFTNDAAMVTADFILRHSH